LHHFVGHPAEEERVCLVEIVDRMTMQVCVGRNCTMIATSVQCDVDGVPKGSRSATVPPIDAVAQSPFGA
jgi:hypothetical protein